MPQQRISTDIATSLPVARKENNWEIPYNELVFGKLVGAGAYGEVYKGTWRNVNIYQKLI